MTDTTQLTFYINHGNAGETFSAWIAGLDCGDYVVGADGSIVVPYGSDPDGLLSNAWLAALVEPAGGWGRQSTHVDVIYLGVAQRYTVPVVLGYTYTSKGQVTRDISQEDGKMQTGPALGTNRRTEMYGALLVNSVGGEIGTNFTNMRPLARYDTDGVTPLNYSEAFDGVAWDTLEADYNFDDMLAWRQTRPYPLTVAAIGTFKVNQERG